MIVKVLAIDPGNEQSGWAFMEGMTVLGAGVDPNAVLVASLIQKRWGVDRVACEWIQSYGMTVGKEVFHTCRWVGRFEQAVDGWRPFRLVYRRAVKLHLCNDTRAKDKNIRQAILDMYPATGGGKTPQVGTKASPGPLYGISSHMWAAVGLALTEQNIEAVGAVQ